MTEYTLIEQRFIRYEQGLPVFIVTIQVDTAADLPDPRESWSAGSMCMIAEDHTYKVLNSEREWV
jgi:hypothetical protein